MARTKRFKQVSFTNVKKKNGIKYKETLGNKIKENIHCGNYVYAVKFESCKTTVLQQIRDLIRPSKIIKAKNRVIQVILGTSKETSLYGDMYLLSAFITEGTAIISSDLPFNELKIILEQFNNLETVPTTGSIASSTIILKPEDNAFDKLQFSIEPYLRTLGLPTRLFNGKIELLGEYKICEAGETLNSKQAKILKLLKHNEGRTKIEFKAYYDKKNNRIEYIGIDNM